MSEPMQLTIDGREVPMSGLRPAPLTVAQREILRAMRTTGTIRPLNAGRIMHAHREHGCWYCSTGVCKHASSDGWSALRRLERRGLVKHPDRGRWLSV